MTTNPISVHDFDVRAAAGDGMAEFFNQYAACNLDVDGLIEEIWLEKQQLARPLHKSQAATNVKSRAARLVERPKDLSVKSVAEPQGAERIIQAVRLTLTTSIREISCMGETWRIASARDVHERLEKAARDGRVTYVALEKRDPKKPELTGRPFPFMRAAIGAR